ncbi:MULTISPECIES: ABC transporter permease [unclassified Sulfitobacter]|jgi:peptide/nickel transport system permease protein|uniref:ABC transporter permease n=2 Tax=Sulfitobacter TaxID=60136 RepID=UPI0007C2CB9B|nr:MULTISPECIES: ABC transporter permease [unclassified Sulfitobacter]KZX92027.1 D-Ala-D-Ala transporter [Sulfitobacter sp. HI0021]KZX95307.1 D-Ala-D-Ala transporter [Sulfitobacter sp. HI0027]KZZ01185.1 D-Ala-D-Ala transporter [Sulfitobacter sp. HI0076]
MRRLEIILSRLVWFIPTLFGLVFVVFFISNVIPTDPARIIAGENATEAQVVALRAEMGLDQPVYIQFGRYVAGLATGDLGKSMYTQREISEDLLRRLPATLELTLAAMILAVGIGVPLGVISAVRRNSMVDQTLRLLSVSGLAVASFWLAMELQMYFSTKLGWTPLNGRIGGWGPEEITGFYVLDSILTQDWASLGDTLHHLLLPAITLALPAAATLVRFTRAGVLEVINSNFVLYERAMGIPAPLIIWKFVLRNALISTVTQIGLIFGALFAGAVVVEAVFDWPGLGTYAVQSILQSDTKAILGFSVVVGVVFIGVNLLVDITHTFIDPRTLK